jgi:hypothetical protein
MLVQPPNTSHFVFQSFEFIWINRLTWFGVIYAQSYVQASPAMTAMPVDNTTIFLKETAMTEDQLEFRHKDPSLYNEDPALVPPSKRTWDWFEIFNVWSNDVQSLFGYTLVASLFISYGLNGWAVFAAIVLAGFIVMVLVNLTDKPGVKYGVPYPMMARVFLSAVCGFPSSTISVSPASLMRWGGNGAAVRYHGHRLLSGQTPKHGPAGGDSVAFQ